MANILIIDDDEMVCQVLAGTMERLGHDVDYKMSLKEGMDRISSDEFDVVFLDVRLPDGNGLKFIPQIRLADSSPEVIIITGEGDPDGAELAIKSGAWDYIEKPPTVDEMTLPLTRALQYRKEKRTHKPSVALNREGIIGNSPPIKQCLDLLAQAANSFANVLIAGETGTGKELFASAIHDNSPRNNKNFVVVDCAALPKTLVESTLFGHEKGAFTGAHKAHEGLVKQADGGTLFLDEVGELPLSIQKTFLRVLEERRFRPVGGKREIGSDFRLVAATNRDLEELIKEGTFRQDLLFRLRSITIELPPLRERGEDIKELAMHYIAKFCDRYNSATKGFSPEFVQTLAGYSWPGNVRELANTMENLLTTTGEDPILYPNHMPTQIRVEVKRASVGKKTKSQKAKKERSADLQKGVGNYRDFRDSAIAETEKHYLQNLMSVSKGNIKEACEISGLSRPRLYALLKKHQIPRSG